jgi:hypothetical protein
MTVPVPQIDPMPLPGPVWLLRSLLLLTFALHLLLMNTLLGGSVVAIVCRLRRRTHALQLARDLAAMLPILFSVTITLGVAPLLFLQVLYGHLLYASSIILGVPWIAVVGMVLVAYYGVYYFSLSSRREKPAPAAAWALSLAIVLLLAIAFVYTNNFTLMLDPSRWFALYGHSASGWNLNWTEPTLVPRYLHFLLSALAITGLLLVVMGLRRRPSPYGQWLVEQGSQLFLAPTMLNVLVGLWWLVWLPSQVRVALLAENWVAMTALGLGFIFALAAVMHLVLAKAGKSAERNAMIAIASAVVTVAMMVILRDALRNASLAPYFRLEQLKAAPQSGIIALFLVVFVIGVGVLAYMLRAVAQAGKSRAADASSAG